MEKELPPSPEDRGLSRIRYRLDQGQVKLGGDRLGGTISQAAETQRGSQVGGGK